ncbi:hypothetical protein [Marinomonas transparens]|uniref:Uncharacterized protein n=1 Tax=Marinomonas transparens TaxID=2795388 RepID=A0A934JSR6_9GAMM|nr:hypothetical protein [Marinomonas transparens]MBJ7540073.1 hypothetical protein [Marinomonas transparens]
MKLDEFSDFEIFFFSDVDYEQMTAQVEYKSEQVFQITMDEGIKNMKVIFFTEFVDTAFKPEYKMGDFMAVLNAASKSLSEYWEDE